MTKKWIELNITLECNWSCSSCVRLCNLKQKNVKSIMNMDDISKIVHEINNCHYNFEHITIIGGEPTTNPNFLEICKYLKNNLEIPLQVLTNGSNDIKYKRIVESLGIKMYVWNNFNNIKIKNDKHINFYISPLYEKMNLKENCGLNCGIGITKYENDIVYAFCSNQVSLCIMLNKTHLLKKSLIDILNTETDILNTEICKNCQFIAKNKILYKNNQKISECFKEGIKKYVEH